MERETLKKLKNNLRRRGWSVRNTPTGTGFYIESPTLSSAGLNHVFTDKDGIKREYSKESFAAMELDRFNCKGVSIRVYERKHFWERDKSVPDNGFWYSHVPSDKFSKWEEKGYTEIPAEDFLKIAELITESQKQYCLDRKKNYSPSLFRIVKNMGSRWLSRNSSHEEIKETYNNNRLRKERGCTDSFKWKV